MDYLNALSISVQRFELEVKLFSQTDCAIAVMLPSLQSTTYIKVIYSFILCLLHVCVGDNLYLPVFNTHMCLLQDMVDFLQQRVVMLAEESSRDAGLLHRVGSELLSLQNSEVQLEGLVEELHAEAHHRASVTESLQAQLHR